MEYRTLGRAGFTVGALGLGTEYLINLPREHVVSVIHAALDQGINYFDLFFAQPAFRDNMGAAFKGRRAQAHLGAHLGATDVDGQSDRTREPKLALQFFEDFLRRYETDYVDVLYLHNCDEPDDYARLMQSDALLGLALKLKQEGKARAIGLSGHTVSTARQAVESGFVDVLMFPVNLAGHAVPGRKEFFELCAARNVALVAMKPYAGGKLLQPETTMKLESWQLGDSIRTEGQTMERPGRVTPVQCLAYVLSQPGLATMVPGCKDLPQLAAATAIWTATPEEKDFAPALAGFQHFVSGECVYCNHCLPCPSRIDIGQTIRLFELAGGKPTAPQREAYAALAAPSGECVECGACDDRCPFGVGPMARILEATAAFA